MTKKKVIGSMSSPALQGGLVILGTAILWSLATLAHLLSPDKASLPIHTLLWAFILCSEINYFVRRDILYPAFIFSIVWLLSTTVYLWFPAEIDPLQWPAVLIVLGGTVCFSIGCALGARPMWTGHPWFSDSHGNPRTRKLLLIYCIAMLPLSIYSTMKLAGTYDLSAAMFAAARQAVVDLQSEGSTVSLNPLLDRTPTIAVSMAFILLMEERRKRIIAIGICVATILGLLSTGRAIWLLLLCGWGFIALLRAHSRSFLVVSKYVAAAGILILLALTLQTLLTKSETQAGVGDRSAIGIATELTADYLAGPLAGFNYIVENPATFRDQSNNTFALILSPLRGLGLRYDPPPPFDPFVPVPFPINALTVFKPFYVDFGPVACCLALLVCGAISGFLFTLATRGNKFAIFAFCYVAYAAIFSPFSNSFILFNRYAYVVLFGVIYFVVIPRLPRVKSLGNRRPAATNVPGSRGNVVSQAKNNWQINTQTGQ